MSVTERVMAVGQWSLRLRPDCPYDIRAGILPFSSIIVLPQWLPLGGLSDTQMMASARYHGVVRRPGPPPTAAPPSAVPPTSVPGHKPRPAFQDASCPDVQMIAIPGTW